MVSSWIYIASNISVEKCIYQPPTLTECLEPKRSWTGFLSLLQCWLLQPCATWLTRQDFSVEGQLSISWISKRHGLETAAWSTAKQHQIGALCPFQTVAHGLAGSKVREDNDMLVHSKWSWRITPAVNWFNWWRFLVNKITKFVFS